MPIRGGGKAAGSRRYRKREAGSEIAWHFLKVFPRSRFSKVSIAAIEVAFFEAQKASV